MKQIIKSVLDCYTDQQINLGSEAARENIASEISEALIRKMIRQAIKKILL